MTKKQKKELYRIIIAFAVAVAAALLNLKSPYDLAMYLVSYFIISYDVLLSAVKNIANGQLFDEKFLMAVASIGAFGIGDYKEAVAVMIFFQIGELFENYAVGKSRKSIAALMDIKPEYANLEKDGDVTEVAPEEVHIGDTIVVKAGERIPLDGVVLSGSSSLDTSALTGESVPRTVSEGDDVISGCINQTGLLKVKVTKEFENSTVVRILELVENAASKKAKAEKFITKFSKYYTPTVVFSAVAITLIPWLIFKQDFSVWFTRALTFLIVSCPCALVVSVPLGFFGGIGGASKQGILVKGGNYFEVMADVDTVVFDKTGTLTKGVFNVTAIHPDEISEADLLETAALCESFSDHPIARSIIEAYGKPVNKNRISDSEEIAGKGVKAIIDNREVCVGNSSLMEELGVEWHPCHKIGTTVHVAINGDYKGHIVISDEIKPGAKEAIAKLKEAGVKKTVMLTGDSDSVGRDVASQLGIDEVHTQLLPEDKVKCVEELFKKKTTNGKLAFVGDGINDAPVLAYADIGIAMGALGSDAAIEAADIVLMNDELSGVACAKKIARRTIKIVRENIYFALGVKFLLLILAAFGISTIWAAVFADVGVLIIAILNSMRALVTSGIK